MSELVHAFLYGVLAAMSCIAALLFARYWRKSRDRFFGFVTTTFLCLAANWASIAGTASEAHAAYFYLPRLAAFLILLAGIFDKNRRASSESKVRATEATSPEPRSH